MRRNTPSTEGQDTNCDNTPLKAPQPFHAKLETNAKLETIQKRSTGTTTLEQDLQNIVNR